MLSFWMLSHSGSPQQLPACDIYSLMLCCLVRVSANLQAITAVSYLTDRPVAQENIPEEGAVLPPRQRNGSVHACITQWVLFVCRFSSCVRKTGRRDFAIRQWKENLSKCAERKRGRGKRGGGERGRARTTICRIQVGHIPNSRKR